MDAPGLLVRGASEVATLSGGVRRGRSQDDISALQSAPDAIAAGRGPAVGCWDGRVLHVGPEDEVRRRFEAAGIPSEHVSTIDVTGTTVTPGLIDPHTHLPFAGTREDELRLRQRGAGYLEILAAGGGILSTVARTVDTAEDELHAHGRRWLGQMLDQGVTTLEAKSGYGLDTETELRLLAVLRALDREGPPEIVPTYLGAHAVPQRYRERPDATDAYLEAVIEGQLPEVAAQGIARFCDVFCERGVFSADQSRRLLDAARGHGLGIRLHADELVASGGAELAADLRAASADHLAAISDRGVEALAAAAVAGEPVVATLLPATTLFLMSDHYAPARRLIDAGVPVALGTDFNPGTSPTPSLPLVMSLACLQLRMTPAEALVAVTINAARTLGLEQTHGSLEPGKQADLVVWDVPRSELIPYWVGGRLARVVIKRGSVVAARDASDAWPRLRA